MTTVNLNLTEATISKLDLKPNDVIVIKVTDPSYRPTASQAAEIRNRVREVCGDHEVIVMAHGINLGIVEPKEET